MRPMKRFSWGLGMALAVLLVLAVAGAAAETGGYALDWFTLAGGGAVVANPSGYALSGTVGQSDAGAVSGGGYSLSGGFWPGSAPQYEVYLPLLTR